MTTTRMPTQNLSLSKKEKEMLRQLADDENRSISKQVVHMMKFYKNYHKSRRKDRDIGDLTELSYDLR